MWRDAMGKGGRAARGRAEGVGRSAREGRRDDGPGALDHFDSVVAAGPGVSGFAGRIDSAWLTAHWGWMPERE